MTDLMKTLIMILTILLVSCSNKEGTTIVKKIDDITLRASFVSAQNILDRKKDSGLHLDSLALNSHFLLEFISNSSNSSPIKIQNMEEISSEMSRVYFEMADNIWLEHSGNKKSPLSVIPEFNYGLSKDMDYFITFDIPEKELREFRLIVNDEIFETGIHQLHWSL